MEITKLHKAVVVNVRTGELLSVHYCIEDALIEANCDYGDEPIEVITLN